MSIRTAWVPVLLTCAAPLAAAPEDPGIGVGSDWRYAACTLSAVCQSDGRCNQVPLPGSTALWQDEAGTIRIGPDESTAADLTIFADPETAAAALADGLEGPLAILLAEETPPPDTLSLALYRRLDDGTLAPRHARLTCRLSDIAPATLPDALPQQPDEPEAALPEAPPDAAPPPEALEDPDALAP